VASKYPHIAHHKPNCEKAIQSHFEVFHQNLESASKNYIWNQTFVCSNKLKEFAFYSSKVSMTGAEIKARRNQSISC
jgi:hypothetical protein